jgi:hypothetical protein
MRKSNLLAAAAIGACLGTWVTMCLNTSQPWSRGGSKGCKTKMVWTGWSHIMTNHVIVPSSEGATGTIYLLQMGIKGPGSIERHGGYEDVYVKTAMGWRIKSRANVREESWLNPLLQTRGLVFKPTPGAN